MLRTQIAINTNLPSQVRIIHCSSTVLVDYILKACNCLNINWGGCTSAKVPKGFPMLGKTYCSTFTQRWLQIAPSLFVFSPKWGRIHEIDDIYKLATVCTYFSWERLAHLVTSSTYILIDLEREEPRNPWNSMKTVCRGHLAVNTSWLKGISCLKYHGRSAAKELKTVASE